MIYILATNFARKGRDDLWKRYKHRDLFVDGSFSELLKYLDCHHEDESIELVLNGDIFDFDSVVEVPSKAPFSVTWLERARGLRSEEKKSLFKIRMILSDHDVWVKALSRFVEQGHRVVFVIGNHDMELHWPSVQQDIVDSLELGSVAAGRVRFCEWFYLSNGDTLIEHGHQHDMYCACQDPIFPLIQRHEDPCVRLPFGNLAARLMMNGMGFFNPHVESSFILSLFGS